MSSLRGKKRERKVPAKRPRTNLAPPLTSFIGRAAALDEIAARFARAERLVTISGPPGMGKTRLALQYAKLNAAAYEEGGVWFVDLTLARTGADLCAAIAKAVHLVLPAGATADEQIRHVGEALARMGTTLLVLDNFEQLAGDAAMSAELWFRAAPQTHLIVTSRERLHVAAESVLELAPIGESDAVRLFEERARAAGAAYTAEVSTVEELARELDGIPLAIELAAARSRLFSPSELLARLKYRFDLLSVGPRGSAQRHATLKAAIDWSWNLLSPWEQDALAQCSVFARGFSLDAAEQVIDVSASAGAPSVIEIIGALRDKSLLWTHESAAPSKTRFALFASIRDYAAEKLTASLRATEARARHAQYYVDGGRTWAEALAFRADPNARVQLVLEQENLSAALEHVSSSTPRTLHATTLAIEAALCLTPVMAMRGFSDSLVAMLERAVMLCATTRGVPQVLHARALNARSAVYAARGRMAEGIADLEKSVALATPLAAHAVVGEALVMLSARYRVSGRLAQAWESNERASAHLELPGLERSRGLNHAVRGLLLGELGRIDEARAENLRAMAIFRELGDRRFEGFALANLAQLDQASGRFVDARWRYGQALAAFRDAGERSDEARYLGWLAALEWEAGEIETARATYSASIGMLAEVGMAHIEALHRASLGALCAFAGQVEDALAQLDVATTLLKNAALRAFSAALEVHRGHVDLALARRAWQSGDRAEAARQKAVALRRLGAAEGRALLDAQVDSPTLFSSSEDVRFAVRMLERELARPIDAAAAPAFSLRLGPDGQWFRLSGGENVDLARRGAVRKILLALVARRLESPGATLDRTALLAYGWPRERVLADAGAKRVRVAISTLRSLGLSAVLLTRDDGYLIDPQVAVTKEEV